MTMSRILIIEDNAELALGVRYNLELEGFEVHVAVDGPSGVDAVQSFAPDLVILDVMLPGMDGFEVLRRIRGAGNRVPVLMLTARSEETDHVRAFRLDADQYVTKPFRLLELLERINMMLRRARVVDDQPAEAPSQSISFGDIEVDHGGRRVLKAGRDVSLTPRAFELLLALIAHPGRAMSRHDLLRQVWKHQADVVTRTVDSHVSELRQKLEDDPDEPRHIVTVWKTGYRFEP
jgi:two-component system response regulator MtrA